MVSSSPRVAHLWCTTLFSRIDSRRRGRSRDTLTVSLYDSSPGSLSPIHMLASGPTATNMPTKWTKGTTKSRLMQVP